ncbi:uncharacterized protein LOC128731442 [Anopheles nili]|uniref:uncharacterized protein LOC128731442 n=1 Tax=Anopheles nili TaxID=185578 RepID=UPI00237B3440|nr:uncharacterized protein LOC128731442 [Anopheles nili]
MDTLGTEIGQKMRSAVKAKLIELGTGSATGYIDDELPDYVMIMVANKRSRQQMVDDLSLFLGSQTEIFVNWLHQVLQKLQEVTLPASATTKPKEVTKKKISEPDDKRKDKKRKEKKAKRRGRSTDEEADVPNASGRTSGAEEENTPPRPAMVLPAGSITEVFANQYIEKAKKSLESDNIPIAKKPAPERAASRERPKTPPSTRDGFEIPSISEIASAAAVHKHHKELCELKEIEQRISEAKRHLKSLGTDISDDDDDISLDLKAIDDDLQPSKLGSVEPVAERQSKTNTSGISGKQRQRITMTSEEPSKRPPAMRSTTPPTRVTESESAIPKKRSVLDRLGTKRLPATVQENDAIVTDVTIRETLTEDRNKPKNGPNTAGGTTNKSTIISLSAHRREEREIYVPLFRRKESADEQQRVKSRPRQEPLTRGRSRERNVRETKSPVSRIPPPTRKEPSRPRSRESTFRRVDSRDTPAIVPKSRTRERSRSREWTREAERVRSDSNSRANNGGTDPVRGRIGSRVIVLPPKPEFNEEMIQVPVASVIKVQPRPVVPKGKQPSKNLLLKAMAEAQRSTVANLKKTIDNTVDTGKHHIGMKRKLLIEIPGATNTHPAGVHYDSDDDEQFHLQETGMIFNYREEDEEDREEESEVVDIANQMLMEDCDVDEEFKEILENEYDVSHPRNLHSHHLEIDPTEEKVSADVIECSVDDKDTKFVVTLDGAYKTSLEESVSPSHTPPRPPAAAESAPKARTSVMDRIGYKGGSLREVSRRSPNPKDSKEMEETLKKRKERFSEKSVVAASVAPKAIGKTTLSPLPSVSRGTTHGSSVSSSKHQRSPKSSSRSSHSMQSHYSSRRRTPSLSPERPARPRKGSPIHSRSKRSSSMRNVSSSPSHLNELLLQRTKELMDDSVSSSPIYMTKSDYDKMEPSSRKRKRVSPIQFNLTDEDDRHDSDDDYHHHRDRRARSRDEYRPRRSRERESDERSSARKDSRRDWERESGERRDIRDANRLKSPGRKIKKLESSRKFDDIPPLLSSVALSGSDGKNSKGGSGGAIKERCKYFPNCRQGDACEFLHPATPCKAFPSCKFGDKCLYLHPMCKYDQTCHRLDCNFMHSKSASSPTSSSLSAPPLASSVVPVQNYKTISAKPLPPLCKYYPNCVNNQCQFLHPKMCRFGKHCVNKIECNFYHYDIPSKDMHDAHSKDKFKWISPFSA